MIASFEGVLAIDEANSGWVHVRWPGSREVLGTGTSVKVAASVDGHAFEATLMPIGDGTHMLPVRAAVRKAIKKTVGDPVTVTIDSRRS